MRSDGEVDGKLYPVGLGRLSSLGQVKVKD
jgi:hypothetical protein